MPLGSPASGCLIGPPVESLELTWRTARRISLRSDPGAAGRESVRCIGASGGSVATNGRPIICSASSLLLRERERESRPEPRPRREPPGVNMSSSELSTRASSSLSMIGAEKLSDVDCMAPSACGGGAYAPLPSRFKLPLLPRMRSPRATGADRCSPSPPLCCAAASGSSALYSASTRLLRSCREPFLRMNKPPPYAQRPAGRG
mmetsp:Transcript_30145/g.96186  ORF Transcript_30145/g.96186 Transcript_30145/m.96186 type:complete len:204 (+) Transcript_30145:1543-2154(+)